MKTSLRERWTPPVTGAGTHRLEYRPPLDWAALRTFLTARATPGVEHVTADGRYQRTLRLGRFVGWLTIGPAAAGDALEVEASAELSLPSRSCSRASGIFSTSISIRATSSRTSALTRCSASWSLDVRAFVSPAPWMGSSSRFAWFWDSR